MFTEFVSSVGLPSVRLPLVSNPPIYLCTGCLASDFTKQMYWLKAKGIKENQQDNDDLVSVQDNSEEEEYYFDEGEKLEVSEGDKLESQGCDGGACNGSVKKYKKKKKRRIDCSGIGGQVLADFLERGGC
eukprot:12271269-Ditylum_brightwellii.AAC.1